MHDGARSFVARVAAELPPCRTLEIGSRNVNGTVRDLFHGEYVGIDLIPGDGVDVVEDVRGYLPAKRFDTIVCCEVLEHAEDPAGIVSAAHRLLRVGGTFILTCATEPRMPHSAIDGGYPRDGEFYRNISPAELSDWLGIFRWHEMDCSVSGDLYAIARR